MSHLMVDPAERTSRASAQTQTQTREEPSSRNPPALGGYQFALVLSALTLAARYALGVSSVALHLLMSIPAVIASTFAAGVGPGVAAAACSVALAVLASHFEAAPSPTSGVAAALVYAGVVALNIETIRRFQRALRAKAKELELSQARLEEQQIFFRDLQHRVANNLQFAASLLSSQRRRVGMDPAAATRALDDARDRLVNMAIIYRRLYDPGEARPSLSAYLQSLCLDLIEASAGDNIACRVACGVAALDDRKLVPLSLILTEIVTNSVKHAFAEDEAGEIRISLDAEGDALVLTVSDNGRGLPEHFDPAPKRGQGQGLLIMQALTRQLGGAIEFSGGSGAAVRLSFPREEH